MRDNTQDLIAPNSQTSVNITYNNTYLIVPGVNTNTHKEEIQHLQTWAADNNLKLNHDKTKEIVIMASRQRAPPPPRPDVELVCRLRVLDVYLSQHDFLPRDAL